MNTSNRLLHTSLVAGAVLALSACASLESDRMDYKTAGRGSALEVPPDLTQLSRDGRLAAPGGVASASSSALTPPPSAMTAQGVAVNSVSDVRIERQGNARWLVVKRPADKLWAPVREFWQDNGFLLSIDDSKVGVMETDWAENRAKIPSDIIRNTLGKLLDSFYSTGERDKFRTRFERNASGETEIYISHRGMAEVYTNKVQDQTVWQPRPSDPELEAEFLRRLLIKLGLPTDQAKAASQNVAAAKPQAQVVTVNGVSAVRLDDGFDRAWRRVGLSLDRTGFTVEDRDRSAGQYFVRYVDPTQDSQKPGLLSRLFSSKDNAATAAKYRVQVKGEGNQSVVTVLDSMGRPDTSGNAGRIIKVLADDLK